MINPIKLSYFRTSSPLGCVLRSPPPPSFWNHPYRLKYYRQRKPSAAKSAQLSNLMTSFFIALSAFAPCARWLTEKQPARKGEQSKKVEEDEEKRNIKEKRLPADCPRQAQDRVVRRQCNVLVVLRENVIKQKATGWKESDRRSLDNISTSG